jgi:methanogenic corrinoid protein MtbC1
LQHLVHELGQRVPREAIVARVNRRAFFTVFPGDQHSFGVVMIEDFFRRAGWQTASAPTSTLDDIVNLVANDWLELIGLTVSYEAHIDALPDIIAALRNKSKNPALLVMVGGRIFTEQPGLAARVGADGTAPDGKQAVLSAEKLLGQLVNPTIAAPSRASG